MIKLTVNLLQPELVPETPFLTLKRVCILWAVIFSVFLFSAIISIYSLNTEKATYKALNKTNNALTQTVSELEVKVSQFKPDEKVVRELKRLKTLMRNKEFFHQQLTDKNRTYVRGFSHAMGELSSLHHKDISLNKVNIKEDDMSFHGIAVSPSAVPNWLSRFEESALLSGKSFVHFHLKENSNKLTEFVVSSQPIDTKPIDTVSLTKGLK